MKLSILVASMLGTLGLTVPSPGPWAPDAISQCEAAPNCETYMNGGITLIRFKPGMGPGSDDYQMRFRSNSTALAKRDSGMDTQVQMGDTSINFGSTAPDGIGGVYHHLYDICHESACDPAGIQVDSQTVTRLDQYSTWAETFQLTLSASGEFDGWAERDNFVDAVVAAASQGVQWTTHNWCVIDRTGESCGSLNEAEQTSFINVARYNNGNMQGFITAQVAVDSGNSGWCGAIAGVFGAIVGAIDPIAGGFFGVVSAICQ